MASTRNIVYTPVDDLPIGGQGPQGYPGPQGYQGISGTQGYQGQSGIGTQGYQGVSGTQGNQGSSGPQGNPAVDLFSSTTPTPTTIGGIPAGMTFTNFTMDQLWGLLLYPYQAPAFTAFTISGQSSSIEVGTSISGSHTFTWSTSNSSNVNTNSVTVKDNTTNTVLGSSLANTGNFVTTLSTTQLTSPGSHQWGISATNTNSQVFSSSFTVSWYWRLYYGTSTNTTLPTSSSITSLSSSNLASGQAATYAYPGGGYKYLCYPDSFAAASVFKDTSTNLGVAMADDTDDPSYSYTVNGFYYALVSVTNSLSQTTNYKVYRTKNILGGSINIQVS